MNKFFKKTTIFALIAKALLLISTEVFAKETYDVDVNHAQVIWHANHFGFSKPAGKFSDIKGKIIFDEKKPENSSVEVEIKIASLTTGLKKFDEHLLGEDFFNEAKYPNAKFISNKIQITKRNQAKIYGELTLCGVKKDIVLDANLNKIGINQFSQKKTIGISAKAKINRSDFGIDFGLPGIGNQVVLDIEIEANLNDKENKNVELDSPKTPDKLTAKWGIVENKSKIDFLVKQDKSEIRGNLKKFSGIINFEANDLKNSQVEIKIDMTSIDIAFAQALELVKTAPWLAVKIYPEAIFKANKFTNLAGKKQFMAHGNLTIKGKTVPVDFEFTFKELTKSNANLIGKAIIKRSDFDIGNKDPKKANDVANEVEINVELEANR
jgi:polyisoprenoid-binding protein YceI